MYILLKNYYDSLLQQVSVDNINLQIIRLLARGCRLLTEILLLQLGYLQMLLKSGLTKWFVIDLYKLLEDYLKG